MQQLFNQLKEEINTLTGLSTAKGVAAPEIDEGKVDLKTATPKQDSVKDDAVNNAVQPLTIAKPLKMDKLMDIIGKKSKIILRNYSNELKADVHAVPASNFD